jgi:hypothetical protein
MRTINAARDGSRARSLEEELAWLEGQLEGDEPQALK